MSENELTFTGVSVGTPTGERTIIEHAPDEQGSDLMSRDAAERGVMVRRVGSDEQYEEIKWMAQIWVAERADGGMRVWSDDVPGLILSGPDAAKVGGDILSAIKVLREYRRKGATS